MAESELDKEHRREEELRNYAIHLESSNYDADDEVIFNDEIYFRNEYLGVRISLIWSIDNRS